MRVSIIAVGFLLFGLAACQETSSPAPVNPKITGAVSPSAETEVSRSVSATEAGLFFRPICQAAYPDVDAARSAAVAKALTYDRERDLFVDPAGRYEMRINEDRCGLRFRTSTPKRQVLEQFSQASTPPDATVEAEGHGNVEIGAGDYPFIGAIRFSGRD